MSDFYEEGGKLVEEVVQPTLKKVYDRSELEDSLVRAKENYRQKQLELTGAEQEVARITEMLDTCDDLNIQSNDDYDRTEDGDSKKA